LNELVTRYFTTWWMPGAVAFATLALLYVSEDLLWTFRLSDALFFFFIPATLLATVAGVVVQFVRKRWARGFGALALTLLASATAVLFLIAAAFSRSSKTMPRPVEEPPRSEASP